ncbi:MAG: apolipoprotein N-acyltransferase [Hyphomicrobiales bacterium]|nr:apolipoprotein N-acyltransferase [Hyphomicrobiales bacterium]MBV9908635.1 apolipoprotein N-acyltransferase [Hyphomicrobiales bacterium]
MLPRAKGPSSLIEGVILSWGWRRRAIAFIAGAAGALALPPFSIFVLIAVPLTVAVWLIDGAQDRGSRRPFVASLRAAFGAGWWMGFGYFLAGLWWVGSALLVEADKFAWALPLAVVALPAALAVFPGVGFALARLLWSPGPWRIFALAFGLGVAEWARGLLFTGFPWNDLGMALGVNLALAQTASLVGLHGLTFLTIAAFAAPATLWRVSDSRFDPAPTIVAALALVLMAAFGELRLMAPASGTAPGVKLRLIQPNVGQDEASFGPENKQAILRRYLDLSERATSPDRSGIRDITHLIWPESAFPFILSRDPQALSEIVDFLGSGATLITGAARREDGDGPPRYFNSIEIVSRDGLSAQRYDKQHLVPFGEYVPFASLLQRAQITQMVEIPGGFEPGSGRRILHIPGLPDAMPLICYEAIFPIELGDLLSGAGRPGWLLNVTDDAWFGLTPGPYQHFAQARLRAIELGLPLVRDANTGISAVLDGFGREIAVAPLGAEGVVDAELPAALAPTLQSRLGSVGATLIGLAFLAAALRGRRRV